MRKTLLLLLFAACYINGLAEKVEIHHIGVGQGDATLIVITNDANQTASILIDAGNSSSKGAAVAATIGSYAAIATNKSIDMMITSHLHSDHLGGIPTVMNVLVSNGWKIGVVIDRTANYAFSSDVDCYDGNSTDQNANNDPQGPEPTSSLVAKYKSYVQGLMDSKLIGGWINVTVGYNLMQLIGIPCKTSLLSVTSNAVVCNKSDGSGDCVSALNYSESVGNENDYSYSFLLQLGSFKYFTGGDMGGESPYVDLETPLLGYFQSRPDAAKFHFCAYKASHHGSEHSTNTAFVSYTKPTVTAVPSALRSFSGTQLPSQNTLSRIQSSSSNSTIFYTYVYVTNPYSGQVSNYRDVIFVVDGNSFETDHKIYVTTYVRNKTTLVVDTSTKADTTIVCNKH